MSRSQISAFVSDETRERLERFVAAHGLKKAAVVERALLHHLQALEELPADIVLPPRLRLGPEGFRRLVERLEAAGEPTPAMRALFGEDDEAEGAP
jgi:predicted DNA-binding protein